MEFLNFQENYKGCDEGLQVLLVDQDPHSLMYMSNVLEEYSYRVTTSKSALIALSMILERPIQFDLIISDVDMSDIEGFEFLKQVTSRSNIPILLISASEEVEVAKKALEQGACFFFHKPIAPHNLVNIWQHLLRYRFEHNQFKKGLSPREVEKYYEDLHGKGKSSFFSPIHFSNLMEMTQMRNPGMIEPTQVLKENENNFGGKICFSNSLEMENVGMAGPSTTFIQNQSSLKDENYLVGKSSSLGKMCSINSAEMDNSGISGPSTILIQNQSNSENGSSSGGDVQLGKRGRDEDHGKNTSSSSSSSSLGYKKKEKQKDKPARLYWNAKLQQKFKEAYEALGETRATPSRIKELMNEPSMTPQHISSFLQKYRAKTKSQNEEANNLKKPKNVNNQISMSQRCLSSFPPSLNSSLPPHQFNSNLNISLPNYSHIHQTPGNLMPDASLSNFRASSSNIGSDNLRPEIQGNIFPGFHPLRPISTTQAINHWQTSVEAPNMVGFQNNVGLGTYIPGHYHPQVLQEVNYGLGMAGESIMATEFVPEPIGVARVQEQNGGLGIEGNNFDMNHELMTEEEIKNIMQHFSEDDSGNHGSSSGGNVSFCSFAQPRTPCTGTPATGEKVNGTFNVDFIEDDMERFLALLELPPYSDDSFITPP